MAGEKSSIAGRIDAGAIATWIYVALMLIWCALIYFYLIKFNLERWPLCFDFIHYYQCGAMTLSGDRYDVYDPQVQLDWTNKIISPIRMKEMWFIQFVPFVFPLMAPFALLAAPQAFIVWCLTGFLIAVIALGKILKPRGWSLPAIVCFAVGGLATYPSWMTTWWGQFAWFYVALMGFFFLCLLKQKDVWGGILLALMSIKPQYIVFFGIIPIAARRWKMLAVSAVTEVLLFVLAGMTIGWENVLGYPNVLKNAEHQGGFMQTGAPVMVSLRGPLSYFLPQQVVLPICFAAMLAVLPLLYIVWRKSYLAGPAHLHWAMALTIVTALIFSPHCHAYDCTFLVLAAALTLPGFKYTDIVQAIPIPYRVWSICLYFYPIISWLMFLRLNNLEDRHYPKAYAAFNILLLVVGTIYFKKKSTQMDVKS